MADPVAATAALAAEGFDVAAPRWMLVTDGVAPDIQSSSAMLHPVAITYASRAEAVEQGGVNIAPVYQRPRETADLVHVAPRVEMVLRSFFDANDREIRRNVMVAAEAAALRQRPRGPGRRSPEITEEAAGIAGKFRAEDFIDAIRRADWQTVGGYAADDLRVALLAELRQAGFEAAQFKDRPDQPPRLALFRLDGVALAPDHLASSIAEARGERDALAEREAQWRAQKTAEELQRLQEERVEAIRGFDLAALAEAGFDTDRHGWHPVQNAVMPDLDPLPDAPRHHLFAAKADARAAARIDYGEERDAVQVFVRPGRPLDLTAAGPPPDILREFWRTSGDTVRHQTGFAGVEDLAAAARTGDWRKAGPHAGEVMAALLDTIQASRQVDSVRLRDPRGLPLTVVMDEADLRVAWNLVVGSEQGDALPRLATDRRGYPAIGIGPRTAALLGLSAAVPRLAAGDTARPETAPPEGRVAADAAEVASIVRGLTDLQSVVVVFDGESYHALDGDARRAAAAAPDQIRLTEYLTRAGEQAEAVLGPHQAGAAAAAIAQALGKPVVLAHPREEEAILLELRVQQPGCAVPDISFVAPWQVDDLKAAALAKEQEARRLGELRDRYTDIALAARSTEIPAVPSADGYLVLGEKAARLASVIGRAGGEAADELHLTADDLQQAAVAAARAGLTLAIAEGLDRCHWSVPEVPAEALRSRDSLGLRQAARAEPRGAAAPPPDAPPAPEKPPPAARDPVTAERYRQATLGLPDDVLGALREGDGYVLFGIPAGRAADLSRLLGQAYAEKRQPDGQVTAQTGFPAWQRHDVARELAPAARLAVAEHGAAPWQVVDPATGQRTGLDMAPAQSAAGQSSAPAAEPWRRTREEAVAEALRRLPAAALPDQRRAATARAAEEHKAALTLAYSDGLAIPPEVLRGYVPAELGIRHPTAGDLARFGYSERPLFFGGPAPPPMPDPARGTRLALVADIEAARERGPHLAAFHVRAGQVADLLSQPLADDVRRPLAATFARLGERWGFDSYVDFERSVVSGSLLQRGGDARALADEVFAGLLRAGFTQLRYRDGTGRAVTAVGRAEDLIDADGLRGIDPTTPPLSVSAAPAAPAARPFDLGGAPVDPPPSPGALPGRPLDMAPAPVARTVARPLDLGIPPHPGSRPALAAASAGGVPMSGSAVNEELQQVEETMAQVLDTLNGLKRDAPAHEAVAALQALDGDGPPVLNQALYDDLRGAAPDLLPLSNGYIVLRDPSQGNQWIAFSHEAFLGACTEEGHIGRNPTFRAQIPVEAIDRLADHSGAYLEGTGAMVAADRRALHAKAREVARAVNPHVDLAIVDRLYGEGESLAASGGRSADRQPVAGLYFTAHRLAAVSDDPSRGDLVEKTYHELFHSIEGLLTDKERDVLAQALSPFEAAYGQRERERLEGEYREVQQRIADGRTQAEKDETLPGIELRTLEDRARFLKERLDQGVKVFQGTSTEERVAEMVARIAAAGERGQDIQALLGVRVPGTTFGQRLDDWKRLNGWNSWRDAVSSILKAGQQDGRSSWHRFVDAMDRWKQTRGLKTWEQVIDQSIVQACGVVAKARTGKIAARAAVFDASGKISIYEAARIAREAGADRLAANYDALASRSQEGMVEAQLLWSDLKRRAGRTDRDIRAAITRSGYQVIKDTARRTTLVAEVDSLARQSLERMTKAVPLAIGEAGPAAAHVGRRALGTEAGAMAARPPLPDQRARPVHMMTLAEFSAAAVERGLVSFVAEQQKLDATGRPAYNGTQPVRTPAVFRLVMPDGSQPLPDIPEASLKQHLGAAASDPAACAREAVRAYHRAFVKAAASDGRYVPARVMTDHPDLRSLAQTVVIDDPRLVTAPAERHRRAAITASAVPGPIIAALGPAEAASQAYALGAEQGGGELAWSRDVNGVLVAGGQRGTYAVVRDDAGGSHLMVSRPGTPDPPPVAWLREADAVAAAHALDQGAATLAQIAAYAAGERRARQPGDPPVQSRPAYLGGGVDVFDGDGDLRKIGMAPDPRGGERVLAAYRAAEAAAAGPWREAYRRPLDLDELYRRDQRLLGELPVDRDGLGRAVGHLRGLGPEAPSEAVARRMVLEDHLARLENDQARRDQATRLYLDVPQDERAAAIARGARVDFASRALYLPQEAPEQVQRDLLARYRPHADAARERVSLEVSGDEVADAVRAGAAFDPVTARFHVPPGLDPAAREHLIQRWGGPRQEAPPAPAADRETMAAERAEPVGGVPPALSRRRAGRPSQPGR